MAKTIKKAMIFVPSFRNNFALSSKQQAAATKFLQDKGYKVLSSAFSDEWDGEKIINVPLRFLAKYVEIMSMCHAVCFCQGWQNDTECKINHEIAKAYNLQIFYENSDTTTCN